MEIITNTMLDGSLNTKDQEVVPKGRVLQLCTYFENLVPTGITARSPFLLQPKNPTLEPVYSNTSADEKKLKIVDEPLPFKNKNSFVSSDLTSTSTPTPSTSTFQNPYFNPLSKPSVSINTSIYQTLASTESLLNLLQLPSHSSTWKQPIPIIKKGNEVGPFVTCYTIPHNHLEKSLKKETSYFNALGRKVKSWFRLSWQRECCRPVSTEMPLLSIPCKDVASFLTSNDAQYWFQFQVYVFSKRDYEASPTLLNGMAQIYNQLYFRIQKLLIQSGKIYKARVKHLQKFIEISELLLKKKNYASFSAIVFALYDFHLTHPYLLLKKDVAQLERLIKLAACLQTTAKNSTRVFSLPFVAPYMYQFQPQPLGGLVDHLQHYFQSPRSPPKFEPQVYQTLSCLFQVSSSSLT